MKPFRIDVSADVLEDLNRRLDATRWPDEIGDHWTYGTDLAYLKDLVDYWRHRFDWRAAEARLNGFEQFTTDIDGESLHFIHQRSSHVHAVPLLISHGWPGSITEFVHIIEPLTQPERFGGDPADAFHVIAPSIPGYGFSQAPRQPGFNQRVCAGRFAELMQRLEYDRYFAQGGDWGSAITTWLGADDAAHVAGIHLNLVFARPPQDEQIAQNITPQEATRMTAIRDKMRNEAGYQQIQGTKPQTLGYGLNDSPAGLAAWIVEKFHGWTQHSGDHEQAVARDDILTNIMVYWVTGCITSSTRLYYESRQNPPKPGAPQRVDTPTAAALFPGELAQPPRSWVEAQFNLVHWSEMDHGGHFAALEAPEALVGDIRAAFRGLR